MRQSRKFGIVLGLLLYNNLDVIQALPVLPSQVKKMSYNRLTFLFVYSYL